MESSITEGLCGREAAKERPTKRAPCPPFHPSKVNALMGELDAAIASVEQLESCLDQYDDVRVDQFTTCPFPAFAHPCSRAAVLPRAPSPTPTHVHAFLPPPSPSPIPADQACATRSRASL